MVTKKQILKLITESKEVLKNWSFPSNRQYEEGYRTAAEAMINKIEALIEDKKDVN